MVALSAAALLLLPGCPADTDGDDGGTTSGGGSSSTTDATKGGLTTPTATGSGPDTGSSSGGDPTATAGSSSSTGDEGSTSTGDDGSSTGETSDCVDENIASAVGANVAEGSNEDMGDDFQLRYCDGGVSTTGGGDGGGDAGTTDPTGMSTSVGSTTGGMDGDGDDYVVSWTAPSSGTFVIDTFGSSIDTVLSVVPPRCGASRAVCNDDCEDLQSAVVYEATEGEVVYIVIEGYSGRRGSFVLNIAEGGVLECEGGTSSGGFESEGMTTGMGTSP